MKRTLTLLTALSMLSLFSLLFALPALAGDAEEASAVPLYLSFSGEVVEVSPAAETETEGQEAQIVLLENADGTQMAFLVGVDTVLLPNALMEPGQQLAAFFNGSEPAAAERLALLLAPSVEGAEMVLTYFDEGLLSEDGTLQLTVDGTTDILDQAGEPYEEDLGNQVLLVVYDPALSQSPSETTPILIVVMDSLVGAPAETAE